jgi:TetR/AcrR family transcriptional repressor of nem operon
MGRISDARTRLIETAIELMSTRGYSAVGVQELCTHAGVHKGSFYYFFPSKRELALAVIDVYRQRILDLWHAAMAIDCAPLERLRWTFERTYEVQYGLMAANGQMHGCPLGNLALELSCQDEEIRQRLRDTFADWIDVVDGILRQAVAAGALPALDTTITAQTVIAYFEGIMMLAKTRNDLAMVTCLPQSVLALVTAAAQTHTR